MSDPHWYALRLRSNHERRARDYLASRGIETFLPAYRVLSQRSDRRTFVQKPLFSGYLFVRSSLSQRERIEVLRAPGAVGLVSFDRGPEEVPAAAVESLRILLGSGRDAEPFPFLRRGQPVQITAGALKGVTGHVLDVGMNRYRVIVSIEMLGRSVAVTLDREELESTPTWVRGR